jgi:sarcosine oxidase subunit gamma
MSALTFGIKGKGAANWLAAQGIALPEQPNTWRVLPQESRILRLGRGEYLIDGAVVAALRTAWHGMPPGDAYLVPRYDAGFMLEGEAARKVLAEICALDTRPEVVRDGVLMTLAAGISVTLICEGGVYRLWCDATYGDYMRRTLQEISS